jgi:hypothetical protein
VPALRRPSKVGTLREVAMDQMATLELAIGELRREVAALDDSKLDTVTNCAPWTVRRLASHALNNSSCGPGS